MLLLSARHIPNATNAIENEDDETTQNRMFFAKMLILQYSLACSPTMAPVKPYTELALI